MLKEKVWHKKKGVKRINELLEREWAVMKEVVVNGGIDFSEIDNRYRLGRGAAQYTFRKLKEEGFIVRETINIKGLSYRYVRAIVISIANTDRFSKTSDNFLAEIISNNGMINKYAFVGDIGSPYGLIMFQPVLNEDDDSIDQINEFVKGLTIETLIVTNVLVGTLVFRRRDNEHTLQFETLVEHGKRTSEKTIGY